MKRYTLILNRFATESFDSFNAACAAADEACGNPDSNESRRIHVRPGNCYATASDECGGPEAQVRANW